MPVAQPPVAQAEAPALPAPDPWLAEPPVEPPKPAPRKAVVPAPPESIPTQTASQREPEPAASVALPVIRVDRTSWHPVAERREATVRIGGGDARRVREGERVGDYQVTRIEPSAVVFERDGNELRRKIGD